MNRKDIFQQLVKLKNRMRGLMRLQVVLDLIMIFAFLRTVLRGDTVNLFGAVLTQNSAMIVTFLIAIIDLCFTQIRKN